MGQSSVEQEVLRSLFYSVVTWIGFLILTWKCVRAWSSYKEQHVFQSKGGPQRAKKNVIVIACLWNASLISSIAGRTQHGSLLLNTAGLFFLTMMFFSGHAPLPFLCQFPLLKISTAPKSVWFTIDGFMWRGQAVLEVTRGGEVNRDGRRKDGKGGENN